MEAQSLAALNFVGLNEGQLTALMQAGWVNGMRATEIKLNDKINNS